MNTQPAKTHLVSIIILYWNNLENLNHCLACLTVQTLKDYETIIIDNGSSNCKVDEWHQKYPGLNLRVNIFSTNLGYAVANNIGVRLAHGKWIALLNADAFPEPDWLEKLLKAAEENPEFSVFASRQLQANSPELLDGAGDAYHMTGLAWRQHYNQLAQDYGHKFEEVFSACPTAALYSREEFINIGGFDEDYFSYFEDVDLGFRLRLSGAKCLYVPEAVVHHVGSASTGKRSDFSVYYGYRNMIWTFFKDMPAPLLWLCLPLHLATLAFFVVYLTARGQGRVILKAIRDAIRGLPNLLVKRREIQRNRKASTRELLRVMSTGLFEPYREFMQRNQKPVA